MRYVRGTDPNRRRDDRVYFAIEGGYWCEPAPHRYLEADYSLEGGKLRFAAAASEGG